MLFFWVNSQLICFRFFLEGGKREEKRTGASGKGEARERRERREKEGRGERRKGEARERRERREKEGRDERKKRAREERERHETKIHQGKTNNSYNDQKNLE